MAESVEEFLARGGQIKSVEEGERTMSSKEVYLATRAPDSVREAAAARKAEQDRMTDISMRNAENQKGAYHPMFGWQ